MIRIGKEADLPQVVEIYNLAVANSTTTYDLEPQTLSQREQWFSTLIEKGYPFLVIEIEKVVAGFGTLEPFNPRRGYRFTAWSSLYLHEKYRGQGWGTRLVQCLIEEAKERSFHCLMAGIDGDNVISMRLHEKLGFKKVAHLKEVGYKFDRWLDVIYMERLLTTSP